MKRRVATRARALDKKSVWDEPPLMIEFTEGGDGKRVFTKEPAAVPHIEPINP